MAPPAWRTSADRSAQPVAGNTAPASRAPTSASRRSSHAPVVTLGSDRLDRHRSRRRRRTASPIHASISGGIAARQPSTRARPVSRSPLQQPRTITVGDGRFVSTTLEVSSVGRVGDPRGVALDDLRGPFGRVVEVAGVHRRDRDQRDLHVGDHAETAPAAAEGPEQLAVLVAARCACSEPSGVTTSNDRTASHAGPWWRTASRGRRRASRRPHRRRARSRRAAPGRGPGWRRRRRPTCSRRRPRPCAPPDRRETSCRRAVTRSTPSTGTHAAIAGGLHAEPDAELGGERHRGDDVTDVVGDDDHRRMVRRRAVPGPRWPARTRRRPG